MPISQLSFGDKVCAASKAAVDRAYDYITPLERGSGTARLNLPRTISDERFLDDKSKVLDTTIINWRSSIPSPNL
jgi:hypothetical protein